MDFNVLPIEVRELNTQLIDHFGVDTVDGQPIWRVVWVNDQYENKLSSFTEEGLQLIHPRVMKMRKYTYLRDCWILERLVVIPEINQQELPEFKKSYECMYAFTKTGKLPPSFRACKFVVDTVYAALGKKSLRKYVDEESKNPHLREQRIKELEDELFGDESSLLGRTVTGEAVAYTGEPKINTSQEK